MKVFKYDISRSQKGELIGEIARPHSTGGIVEGKITPPRHNKATHSWRVIGDAGYNDSRPNLAYPFPVCFCMGQFSCGTEAPIWEWVILMPATKPSHQANCEVLRSQFPDAVAMLQDQYEDMLESINPAEVENLLTQCQANPDKIGRAVAKYSDHVDRLDFDTGR